MPCSGYSMSILLHVETENYRDHGEEWVINTGPKVISKVSSWTDSQSDTSRLL
jgi:hypothetical protein